MRENAVCRYCVFKNRKTKYILDFTKSYHNLLQKEEAGNTQTYIWDREAVFLEENGESYSYLNDMQGSAMRLLNHGGEDMISYRYDEFGADLTGNQGQLQPFGYTGYQKDSVAGTYYAQARKYDAWSGRFTGEDVIKGSAEVTIDGENYPLKSMECKYKGRSTVTTQGGKCLSSEQ